MNTDFKNIMSVKTDEELVKIATIDRNDYQQDAVNAAELEIKTRNLDISNFTNYINDIEAKQEIIKQTEKKSVSSVVRFFHHCVDCICILIILFICLFLIASIFQYVLKLDFKTSEPFLYFCQFVLLLIVPFFYFYLIETKYQKTIGKFLSKTSVLKENGEKPTKQDIKTRTFCRYIPLDRISFLFVKNGIHDKLSNTILVKDSFKLAN